MHDLTVVFDLDGTLVETAPDLIRATNHALEQCGLEPVAAAEIRPFISFGARAMIRRGLQFHGHHVSESRFEELFARFLSYYSDNIAVESHLFPELRDSLAKLDRECARLAVCTNKMEALSRKLLSALGIADMFAAIAGRDTFPVCKPHPDHLLGVIRMAGGATHRAVLVGDSDVDIATAKAARVPVIAVTFGYTDIPVTSLSPDATIDHYRDLEAAIQRVAPR